MEHKHLQDCLVIEIFAGTGGITAWIRRLGMTSSFGIDSMKFNHPKSPIVILDLLTPEGERLLWHYLHNDRAIGIWIAPPCGTSSKARQIANGGPPPLRSDLRPDGLEGLSIQDSDRVEKANMLYWLTSQLADFAFDNGLFFFIENPFTSVYWKTSAFRSIQKLSLMFFQSHVACAYGSRRPKRTMVASNVPEVEMLCHGCPGNHTHLKWGQVTVKGRKVFATSTEKHYPAGLCAYVAKIVLHICEQYKLQLPMDSLQTANADLSKILSMARAQTSQFSRSKLPQLLPEYKQVLKLVHDDPSIAENSHIQSDTKVTLLDGSRATIPAQSKLLTKLPYETKKGEGDGNFPFFCCSWGIQWNDLEFICAAVELGHPKSFLKTLPEELYEVIAKLSSWQDADIVEARACWLKKWVNRANELRMEESHLHSTIDSEGAKVVSSKRILLFKEMLDEAGYYDKSIADILHEGVPLVGPVCKSGHFPETFKPALISKELLEEKSDDIVGAIVASTSSSGDPECDKFVYSETMKEVERGWLRGPVERSSLPKGCSVSKRFGLWQKTKYRCIDDFSGSLVNATCSIFESPLLHTIDISSAMLNSWMCSMNDNSCRQQILGRSFDLKAAYRQLFIKASDRKHSYISVFNPSSNQVEIFNAVALPFGSVQSVYNFLRISHALWYLGATQLLLPWTCFYDDFLCFSTSSLADNAEMCVSLFFRLLGWRIAEDGSKAKGFDNIFDCLGVVFDLTSTQSDSSVKIRNTESRVKELVKDIDAVLTSGKLNKTMGNKLRGRMQFAENQIFGRLNRRCLKAIAEHCSIGNDKLTHQTIFLLRDFVAALSVGRPRNISAKLSDTWFIFTDAFYEASSDPVAGVGGVLVTPYGTISEYFSEPIEPQMASILGHGTKGTIIFEAELLAVWIAVKLWRSFFSDSMLVVYVDNDALRFSYAASTSRAGIVGKMLELLNLVEEQQNIHVWVARVPTRCNIADNPSRFDCSFLDKCKALRRHVKPCLDVLRI